jgi:DNA-binding transcriptional regulator GbsR (MarR family)
MSDKIKLREGQVALIERLAALNQDLPPAMAKVLALLFVSDEVELTFDQIKDTLNLSKGATSQALNHLMLTKKIESINHLGERRRYFKSRVAGWKQDISDILEGLGTQVEAYRDIVKQRPAKTSAFNRDLEEMANFIDFIRGELSTAVKKYTGK